MPVTWQFGNASAATSNQPQRCTLIQASLTHIHGPDACASANIEGGPWVIHRRKEKLAVEGQVEQVVLQIQSICLALRVDQRH